MIPLYSKWAKRGDFGADEVLWLYTRFGESTLLILFFALLKSTVSKMKTLRWKNTLSIHYLFN